MHDDQLHRDVCLIGKRRSNAFLRDLAGNAFASTVISAIVLAIIFSVEPNSTKVEEATSLDDAEAAVALLKRLRTK